jgi:hypothetical protein
MGRPSSYSDEIAEAICERLASGESLRSICRDNDMPGRQTVLDWLEADAGFRARYARAREHQADYLDEKMQEVADEATAANVHVARLRVATMQWRASKLAPKRYGDKLDLNHSGTVQSLTDEQLDAKLSLLMAKYAQSDGEG